eukprot:TRINITY_DN7663_c0_g1_i2.p2 TRINITY_DN7663_c0_g1~~TRINITY_DN7663_c0_g1_i2.p2  ORF type:complete len:169 (-),score=46.71 TRINITY_DN7663_c0_g1_i2:115-621(-)
MKLRIDVPKPFDAIREVQNAHKEVVDIIKAKLNDKLQKRKEERIRKLEERLCDLDDELETFTQFQQLNKDRRRYQEDLETIKCQYIEAEITAEMEIKLLKRELNTLRKTRRDALDISFDADESKILDESSIKPKKIHHLRFKSSFTNPLPANRISSLIKEIKCFLEEN